MKTAPINLWNPNQRVPKEPVSKLAEYQKGVIQEDRSIPMRIKQIKADIRKFGTETEIEQL